MNKNDPAMNALADALTAASDAYRHVANEEMGKGYGSIDRVYDCVRNARNLSNKARKVQQFGSTY
jgi:hypothetical protein